jgi:nitrile hydratase
MKDSGNYQPYSYFQLMEVSLRELLVEKRIVSEAQVAAAVEDMRERTPERGAKVAARAWVDGSFKKKLLENGSRACEDLGLDIPDLKLVVVENTPREHNMVVCTLCSCYPWPLLGLPPVWYKSAAYRSRAVLDPRSVLADFGVTLPETTDIRVWDSTAELRHLVIPMRPAGTDGWSEDELAALVTRDSMIGTGCALDPDQVSRS